MANNDIKLEIKPYRDIWFKDCFHMALIPAVIHCLGNADCLFFNHYWKYSIENKSLKGKLKENNNVYEMLNSLGVKCKPYTYIDCSLEKIINEALENKNYIIVGVDNYYEEIRKDFYKQKHSGHSILINGVNYFDKTYSVLEQPFFYSYEYEEKQIGYESLYMSHNSYVARMNDDDFFYNNLTEITRINDKIPMGCMISSVKIEEQKKNNIIRKKYINELLDNKMDKLMSLECLHLFSDCFYDIYCCCENENERSKLIIRNLSDVINMRQLENYLYKMLIGDKFIEDKLGKEICSKITMIRSMIAKYMFSHKKNNTHIQSCYEILNSIYSDEIEYYTGIFEKLERGNNYD